MKIVSPNTVAQYNKDIFSRNILFHSEIVRISEECFKQNIRLILLKGTAMIEMFPEYSFERELEDIDVLVEKKVYKKFKKLLSELGYEEVLCDPHAMFNKQKNVQIDIETKLWYLNEKENKKVI
ncbi:MAG: nucleotidyltransferase family protein, partial [Endomicrobiia bacterium]